MLISINGVAYITLQEAARLCEEAGRDREILVSLVGQGFLTARELPLWPQFDGRRFREDKPLQRDIVVNAAEFDSCLYPRK